LSRGYPLAALLRVRAREAEAAAAVLAGALRSEAEAGAVVEEHARERDRLLLRRAHAPAASGAASALQAEARFDAWLRREILAAAGRVTAACEELARARARVSAARAELARAGRARDGVERHRARWEALRRSARERAEDAVTDDLAAARGAAAHERG
jgi:flagellar export protein FliJ